MSDITERLRYRLDRGGPGTPCIIGYSDSGVTLEIDVTEAADTIVAERALADDLNAAIDRWLACVDDNDLVRSVEAMAEIKRVQARWRKARGL